MKLGEMLIRDGRLTESQLSHVLTQQGQDGVRIGTILYEVGLIDLDTLTVYLGLELGIPIASGAMLERAKRSAVKLLTAQQAAKHRCIPLILQDRQLIAAIDDPLDFENLDALSDITGYRVIPRVAPEIRIAYYVERFYGFPRSPRYAQFGESPRGDKQAPEGLPAPPLPGLPPVATMIIAPPGPSPHLRSTPEVEAFDNSEALELEAEDLLDALDADETQAAEAAPISKSEAAVAPRSSRPSQRLIPTNEATPLAAEAAISAIDTATERGQIVDALIGFAASMFDVSVLFVVRDNLAMGWRASGSAPGNQYVEHVLIPLDSPSMLQAALSADDGFFDGAPSSSTLHTYFYKVLGCDEPVRATATVVTIGRRAVNIMYGHRAQRPALSPDELAEIRSVCRAAAESYARLIAASKNRS